MTVPKRQPWIVLRFVLRMDGLWLAVRDDRDEWREPPMEPTDWRFVPAFLSPAPQPLLPAGVSLPPDFDALLGRALERREVRFTEGGTTYLPPVALFVEPPAGHGANAWERLADDLVAGILPPDARQTVRLAPRRSLERAPFRLPLRVLAVGERSRDSLAELRSAPWYAGSERVQRYGLTLTDTTAIDLRSALRAAAVAPDVLVVDDATVTVALDAVARVRPAARRPRLLLVLDPTLNEAFARTLPLPPGVAALWLPTLGGPEAAAFVRAFLYGVIHDLPLHAALHQASLDVPPLATAPLLTADPHSVQSLRFADAAVQLVDEATSLGTEVSAGDDAFAARVGALPESLRDALQQARGAADEMERQLADSRQVQYRFQRESWGLVPLANAEADLAAARRERERVAEIFASAAERPEVRTFLEANQQRRVDIGLEQFEATSVYRDLSTIELLQAGGRYRLRVHIGNRSGSTLFAEEAPPIDPLLPDPEGESGHLLDVVVFEQDFTLLGARVQKLRLPALGGSEPLYFALRAPASGGPARLRVGVYLGNHLLQAFVLDAWVQSENEARHPDPFPLRVRLVASRSARFRNLAELGPRALFVGVNQDATGGSHSFFFKRGDAASSSVRLTETIVHEQITAFRNLLEQQTFRPNRAPRHPTYPAPGSPPSEEFRAAVRAFAAFGKDLYRALVNRADRAMQTRLRELRERANEVIQVIRHDPNLAFPWSVLYDYPLPVARAGAEPLPVCMGVPFDDDGGDDGGDDAPASAGRPVGCPHNPHRRVICVEGFWGVRHQIEQLIERGDVLDDVVDTVAPVRRRGGVALAFNTDDQPTADLRSALEEELADTLAVLTDESHLLDLLWDPRSRPAVLIVLGHLETAEIRDEPKAPRIALLPRELFPTSGPAPNDLWLMADEITDANGDLGPWQVQPRTVVLLMACSSGATDIDTLNDFLTALTGAGAAAVVGTEASVFSGLAARFAREVVLDLWRGNSTLGQAVQAFNQRLIHAGNPLAFSFSCYGNADLRLG